jgi:hypothetical protein
MQHEARTLIEASIQGWLMYSGQRMDFRRNKTYHDILAEQRQDPEDHLLPNATVRWMIATVALLAYAAALVSLYWVSNVGFVEEVVPITQPLWRRAMGLVLNTAAVGFGVMFMVSLVLWALKTCRARYPVAFGVLGMISALLVASAL